jgi:hypothetical protein
MAFESWGVARGHRRVPCFACGGGGSLYDCARRRDAAWLVAGMAGDCGGLGRVGPDGSVARTVAGSR